MFTFIALGVAVLLVLGLAATLIRLRNRPTTGSAPPDKPTEPMTGGDGQASTTDMDPGHPNIHAGPSDARPQKRPRS